MERKITRSQPPPQASSPPASPQAGSPSQLDPEVERQLQESRSRSARPFSTRERRIEYSIAGAFLAATLALIILFPDGRELSAPVALTLVLAYAVAARVKFEVGSCFTVPTQLVFVPMLFLLPVTVVPLVVVLGILLSEAPGLIRGRRHHERAVSAIADGWHTLGPVLVFAVAGSPEPLLEHWPVLLLALVAQFAADVLVNTPREWLEFGQKPRDQLEGVAWTFGIDALLSPIGLLAAAMAAQTQFAVLLVVPLVALIAIFADERRARIDAALELSDAYRGTTMALADVLDSDDEYTGSHSRMVVSLTAAVGERLRLDASSLRRLEFGALLHDIGKIDVPTEVINKPGPLSPDEWELIKQHTVKGQEILERVGGVLGEVGVIVRGSHERWDGGGYPDGLVGEATPIESRIISCCDAYNAMTTTRSYRTAMSTAEAMIELEDNSGTQFDPAVVTALIGLIVEEAPGTAPERAVTGARADELQPVTSPEAAYG